MIIMGMDCPYCNTRQAIVRNITANGEGARKASDVLAQKLACGHTVGGEEYNQFQAEVASIQKMASDQIRRIQDRATTEKAALWKQITAKPQEDEN